MSTVDKRTDLPLNEFYQTYLNPLKPVVLTSVSKHWAAHGKWTPAWFKEQYADKEVEIAGNRHQIGSLVDQILASSDDNPAPYLKECDISSVFPELMADAPILPICLPNRLMSPLLYHIVPDNPGMRHGFPELLFGGLGGRFNLHYDNWGVHAFVTQVYGDKEFTVYPPDQTPYLYPREDKKNSSAIQEFYPVDVDRFPLYKKATPMTVVVKQGETIFVPCGWWHMTRMLTPSIAVSFNSVSRSNWRFFNADMVRLIREKKKGSLAAAGFSSYLALLTPYFVMAGK